MFIVVILSGIVCFSWLLSRNIHMHETIAQKPTSGITHKITVWIHGTRGKEIVPVGISSNMSQVEKAICTAPLGLHKANSIDKRFHNQTIARILSKAAPDAFSYKHFYSFGWSGKLDPAARKQASEQLYSELKQLVLSYIVQYAAVPEVTLITHSHGGNVALNLVHFHAEESPLCINRLVLLACPVQQETASLVDSTLFASVYALHSHADAIQILDPQGLHPIGHGIKESWNSASLKPLAQSAKESSQTPLFSERHFTSNKVHHMAISWKEKAPWSEADLAVFGPLANVVKKWATWDTKPRGLLHIEFLLPSFLSKLPAILAISGVKPGSQKELDREIAL